MKLSQQKCVPCEGGTPSINRSDTEKYLQKLTNWKLNDNKISKEFVFPNFTASIKFVDSVAKISEKEDHHPNIYIEYNKVKIVLWTHTIDGLSINDFILAAKLDEIKVE